MCGFQTILALIVSSASSNSGDALSSGSPDGWCVAPRRAARRAARSARSCSLVVVVAVAVVVIVIGIVVIVVVVAAFAVAVVAVVVVAAAVAVAAAAHDNDGQRRLPPPPPPPPPLAPRSGDKCLIVTAGGSLVGYGIYLLWEHARDLRRIKRADKLS